jgi:hypothetical protein
MKIERPVTAELISFEEAAKLERLLPYIQNWLGCDDYHGFREKISDSFSESLSP